ncbi:ubiquitin carboxyl-terminal hydrolase 2 [Anaeramoeba flamelloides]|uniref:Ubiquitin carboxyl-terminal hydrolase n=1 Tax=Anaeramoeba flamelloides TaxID=1746091 RepID=A0ABQ8YRZ6_9EUKA|nr:ubiquitin carboxyl-terminal hydrolase 2 [Anaeramoeba flamelloides]
MSDNTKEEITINKEKIKPRNNKNDLQTNETTTEVGSLNTTNKNTNKKSTMLDNEDNNIFSNLKSTLSIENIPKDKLWIWNETEQRNSSRKRNNLKRNRSSDDIDNSLNNNENIIKKDFENTVYGSDSKNSHGNMLGNNLMDYNLNKAIEQSLMDQQNQTNDESVTSKTDPNSRVGIKGMYKGLKNIGNTCYMNSLLQTYFHLEIFRNQIFSFHPTKNEWENLKKEFNISVKKEVEGIEKSISIIHELQNLFSQMILSNQKYVNPSNILKNINESNTNFRFRQQQDITEFNHIFWEKIDKGIIYIKKLFKKKGEFENENNIVYNIKNENTSMLGNNIKIQKGGEIKMNNKNENENIPKNEPTNENDLKKENENENENENDNKNKTEINIEKEKENKTEKENENIKKTENNEQNKYQKENEKKKDNRNENENDNKNKTEINVENKNEKENEKENENINKTEKIDQENNDHNKSNVNKNVNENENENENDLENLTNNIVQVSIKTKNFDQNIDDNNLENNKVDENKIKSIENVFFKKNNLIFLKNELVSNLFFGEMIQLLTVTKKSKEEEMVRKSDTTFREIILNVENGDIYSALDNYTIGEQVEIKNEENLNSFGIIERVFKKIPPVLFLLLQRIIYDKNAKRAKKNNQPFTFQKEIYLDRYMEENYTNTKRARNQVKNLQKKIEILKTKLKEIQNFNNSGESLNVILQTTLLYLNHKLKKSKKLSKEERLQYQKSIQITEKNLLNVEEELKYLKSTIEKSQKKLDGIYTQVKKIKYHLHAVLVHRGNAGSGHYFCYILDHCNQKWFKYNDSDVTEINEKDVFEKSIGNIKNTESAYCLVYISDETKKSQIKSDLKLETLQKLVPVELISENKQLNLSFIKELETWEELKKEEEERKEEEEEEEEEEKEEKKEGGESDENFKNNENTYS